MHGPFPPEGLVQTTAQPAGLVFKMFADYFGSVALLTTVTNSPEFTACWPNCPEAEANYPVIEALASKHPDGRLAILIINKDVDLDVEVEITVQSSMPRNGNVTWAILNSADPSLHPGTVTNTLEDPDAVSITTTVLPLTEPLRLTIPAHTVNMVVLPACIPPVGDVNADGRVGIVDIMLVAGQLGLPNPDLTYDVDNDGNVDLADIRLTASQWRQTCSSSSIFP